MKHGVQSVIIALSVLVLSACANTRANRAEMVRYDLNTDTLPAVATTLPTLQIRAPAWLQTPAMQYKLAYAEPALRYSFSNARWVAPPPELLEAALRRSVVWPARWSACRMPLELDEFVQRFVTERDSVAVIELRVRLQGAGGKVLGEQAWSVREVSATADAAGGAAAQVSATKRLLTEMNTWLSALAETADINKHCSAL